MIAVNFGFGTQLSPRNAAEGIGIPKAVQDRMQNLAPWAEKLPDIMRTGPGSISEQILTRTFMDSRGGSHPWEEPAYAQGKRPAAAVASEELMFAAARGEAPGAITHLLDNGASLAVDDNVIRLQAANLPNANRLVSTQPYFPFFTGGWARRTTPGKAMPGKPTVPFRGQRAARGQGKKPEYQPRNFSAYGVRQAMFWWLGFNFDYWPTEAELRAGIDVPPKNIGISLQMKQRALKALGEYLIPGGGSGSGFNRPRDERGRFIAAGGAA